MRAFADELDDPTGDLVAANLILGARRRGAGVASVLEALAESVAADVRARREIEADRAKPRSTARWVTIITVGPLANGSSVPAWPSLRPSAGRSWRRTPNDVGPAGLSTRNSPGCGIGREL